MQVCELDVGIVVGEVSSPPKLMTDLVFDGVTYRVSSVRPNFPGGKVRVWVFRIGRATPRSIGDRWNDHSEKDFLIRMGLRERSWRPGKEQL